MFAKGASAGALRLVSLGLGYNVSCGDCDGGYKRMGDGQGSGAEGAEGAHLFTLLAAVVTAQCQVFFKATRSSCIGVVSP